MRDVFHKKTGNIYTILDHAVIDTTNSAGGDVVMVLYQNTMGQKFVREADEFWEKFQSVD